MPRYWFQMKGEREGDDVDLPNDDVAYTQLLLWSRDVLQDVERELPPCREIELSVSEGDRRIATINLIASRSLN